MNTIKEQRKLDFLNKLLEKNPELQQQFTEFINDRDAGEPCEFDTEKHVREEAENFIQELEMMSFDDPDWEVYVPRHNGYIPEWEARTHLAEDMVTGRFKELEDSLERTFSEAKTDCALLALAAAYDACLKADIRDSYEALYDHQSILLENLKELQRTVIDKIKKMVIPNRQVYCFFRGLLGHYKNKYPDNENYLAFFEPLLISLICEKERACYMENLIQEYEIPRHLIPRLATEIFRITEDRSKWTEQAEEHFEQNVDVARELLNDYIENSYDDFIRIAKKLWAGSRFKQELGALIFQNINRDKSPELYKQVLLWLTSTRRKLSDYSLLRDVLPKEEKETFIQEHKRDHVFYTGMLHREKRYREILLFIRNHTGSRQLNGMLKTVLEPYPEESFAILKKKVLNTVEIERGRAVYKQIVQWLLLARTIKGMKQPTDKLVCQLYNWQPRLPALRDELKKQVC